MQRTKSKILSILLSLVMLLSLLPTTALAADYEDVKVNNETLRDGQYLESNSADTASNSSTEPTTYVAWYKDGVLTLNGYEGNYIQVQGATKSDLTVKLKGSNTITSSWRAGIIQNGKGGSITVTADSSSSDRKLTINATCSNSAAGIDNGTVVNDIRGDVTIKGHADVTINATTSGLNELSCGIYGGKVVIEENAKAAITVKATKNTGGGFVYGIYAKDNVTINTAGEITVDASEAGTGEYVYSYGVNSMNTLTLTKVGGMTVKWNDNLGNNGWPLSPNASFGSAYDTTVDKSNKSKCVATYTPKGTAITGDLPVAITKPVKGETPQSAIAAATQYTGTIAWEGNPTTFAADTEYTANVTLTAKEGYQFADDVNPTVTDATISDKNVSPDGKTLTFKAAFDKTGTATLKGIKIIDKIDGQPLTVAVPHAAPNTTETKTLTLVATSVYDAAPGGPVAATWEITTTPKPTGVSIDATTGKLTVTNEAEGNGVRVLATYTDGSTTHTDAVTVAITKDVSKETAIVATAPAGGTDITIPNGGTNTSSGNCSYTVYDQYGAEMPGTTATWKMKLDPADATDVHLIDANGSISVTSGATACKAILYAEGSGVKSNEITFNIARAASVAKTLEINVTPDSVNVPTVTEPGTTKCAYATYTAIVKDQYGAKMDGQTIEWSFTDKPGVTFNNGQLTVTNKATAGDVTITAKSGTLTATKDVTINKDTAKETFVKITAQDNEPPVTIITCTGTQRLEYYTATVYDQYGNEKQDDVTWSLDPAVSGVGYEVSAINKNSVTLKVAPDADEGTFKLVATSQTVTTVKGELEITVQKKNDVSGKIIFNEGSLPYNGNGQEYKTATLDSSVTAGTGGAWTYTYAVKSGATGALDAAGLPKIVGTYTVTATYEDSLNIGSKSVILTITAKKVAIPVADPVEYTYDGNEKIYNIPTSPYYTVSGNKQTNANEGGYLVTVALKDSTNTIWSDDTTGVKIYHFYIYKATPTGEPTYTEITASGKRLADAALGVGTIKPAGGEIAWNDPTSTAVVANTSYGWTYTPADTTNYKPLTGTIKLWNKSTSSGGYYYAPTTAVVPDMPMLYRGCTGDAVKTLQDKLNALGYNSGSVDGIFGAKTYAAVTAFQKANSLGVDGIVGKLTWGKLYGVSPAMPVETTTVVGRPTVSYGSRGDAVRKLQELLNALGYDCGSVDGIFGSKTKAAVLAFQKANGLGVDGIVGPLTWAKLG